MYGLGFRVEGSGFRVLGIGSQQELAELKARVAELEEQLKAPKASPAIIEIP